MICAVAKFGKTDNKNVENGGAATYPDCVTPAPDYVPVFTGRRVGVGAPPPGGWPLTNPNWICFHEDEVGEGELNPDDCYERAEAYVRLNQEAWRSMRQDFAMTNQQSDLCDQWKNLRELLKHQIRVEDWLLSICGVPGVTGSSTPPCTFTAEQKEELRGLKKFQEEILAALNAGITAEYP